MYSEMNWLQMCVSLIVLLSGIWFYRSFTKKVEGFQQKEPFILREDNDVYDDFYIPEHDKLFKTDMYSEDDVQTIILYTQPSIDTSSFLDVGCGSGSLLKKLQDKHFTVFGVDKSSSMVNHAKQNLNNDEIVCKDVLDDPMLYENKSFSHILCTHFTIYEIEDKTKLMRHCFHWLKSGGFLVVHIVDIEKFNMVVPNSELYSHMDVQQKRIRNTTIENEEYTYKNKYLDKNDATIQVEEFQKNGIVRQNERKLYFEKKENIIACALKCGFLVHADASYDKFDSQQYLVIFAKPQCGDC